MKRQSNINEEINSSPGTKLQQHQQQYTIASTTVYAGMTSYRVGQIK